MHFYRLHYSNVFESKYIFSSQIIFTSPTMGRTRRELAGRGHFKAIFTLLLFQYLLNRVLSLKDIGKCSKFKSKIIRFFKFVIVYDQIYRH